MKALILALALVVPHAEAMTCKQIADYIALIVEARDEGVPMENMLASVRKFFVPLTIRVYTEDYYKDTTPAEAWDYAYKGCNK